MFTFKKSSAIKSLWLTLSTIIPHTQCSHLCRELHCVLTEGDVQVFWSRKAQMDIKANLIHLQEITVIPGSTKTRKRGSFSELSSHLFWLWREHLKLLAFWTQIHHDKAQPLAPPKHKIPLTGCAYIPTGMETISWAYWGNTSQTIH